MRIVCTAESGIIIILMYGLYTLGYILIMRFCNTALAYVNISNCNYITLVEIKMIGYRKKPLAGLIIDIKFGHGMLF